MNAMSRTGSREKEKDIAVLCLHPHVSPACLRSRQRTASRSFPDFRLPRFLCALNDPSSKGSRLCHPSMPTQRSRPAQATAAAEGPGPPRQRKEATEGEISVPVSSRSQLSAPDEVRRAETPHVEWPIRVCRGPMVDHCNCINGSRRANASLSPQRRVLQRAFRRQRSNETAPRHPIGRSSPASTGRGGIQRTGRRPDRPARAARGASDSDRCAPASCCETFTDWDASIDRDVSDFLMARYLSTLHFTSPRQAPI